MTGSSAGAWVVRIGIVGGLAAAPPPLLAQWDVEEAARIAAEAEARPYGVLRLEPGERLRYRVRSVALPPRIPLVSSGRAVSVEAFPELFVTGLDPGGYRVALRVRSTASDPEAVRVRPEATGAFAIDSRGRLDGSLGPDEDAAVANGCQLLRDLSDFANQDQAWSEERWSYFHRSRMGIPRIRTRCTYQPAGIDPATGHLHAAIEVRETPEERSRGRGYHAEGTVEIDRRGRLVHLETEGRLWKKAFLLTVAVRSRYEARLLDQDRVRAAAPEGSRP